MEEKKLFRGAVNGFNKQDVTNYIATLSQKNQIEIDDLKQKVSDLEEKLEISDKKNLKLEETAQVANEEMMKMRKQWESYANKARLYEELQQNIGQLMIETQKTADSIIEEAVQSSNLIKQNAQAEVSELHKKSNELFKNVPVVASKLNIELDIIKDKIAVFLNDYKNAMQHLQISNTNSTPIKQSDPQEVVEVIEQNELQERDKKWRFF